MTAGVGREVDMTDDDEAMRIVNGELFPVLDRLSDRRPVATLPDALADLRGRREHLDDAMRILTERVLPVCERLGKVEYVTVARKQIAEMLEARDKVDHMLRVYHRDTPVFETLEDARAEFATLAERSQSQT
jgi:hypothetical protein